MTRMQINALRRWFRFSLRGLFVVVTLAAIGLGLWANKLRRQKAAIEAIDALGGTYGVRIEGPEWLRNLLTDERYFYNASRVSFGPGNAGYDPSRPFTDEELANVIDQLNAFTLLTGLYLDGSDITNDGLPHLSRVRNLQRLGLARTAVTDRGLAHLEGLRDLRELELSRHYISAEGVGRLRQALPNCKITVLP